MKQAMNRKQNTLQEPRPVGAVRARLRLLKRGQTPAKQPAAATIPSPESLLPFCPSQETDTENTVDPREHARMNRRFYWRMSLIVLGTLVAYAVWILCSPFALASPERRRAIRRGILKRWGRAMLRIVRAKVRIEGAPPTPPFFLVANHLSYVDIFLLASQTGCVFVARSDMATWPVLGFMMRTAQQLFIEREQLRDAKRVIGLIAQVLDEKDGMAVFAEARCGRGDCVLPFKPSLFEPAVLRNFPVHCASIHYETPEGYPAAGDNVVWWRWEPIEDHLRRLLTLPGFTATVRYADAPVVGSDRKILARGSHQTVNDIFTPITQGALEELPAPDWLPNYLR